MELTPEDEENAIAFGLVKTFAYHCTRCNYLWLPKDYDYGHEYILKVAWSRTPKSCARCKSKYWRKERQRSVLIRYGQTDDGRVINSKTEIKTEIRRKKASGVLSDAIIKQLESIPKAK